MRSALGVPAGTYTFRRIGIGAGGYATGLKIAADGTRVIRTDTWNGWVRGPSDTQWTPLIKLGTAGNVSIANGKWQYVGGAGTYEVSIADTDSNYIITQTMGFHYLSTDRGVTQTKLSILAGNQSYYANEDWKTRCHRANFDPNNKVNFITTDPTVTTGGAYFSTTIGSTNTFTKIASVPANSSIARPLCVAFDPASLSGGKSQRVAILVEGSGVYLSTTGLDGTFALMSGSPTTCASMQWIGSGCLIVAGTMLTGEGPVKRWNTTTWSTVVASGLKELAVDRNSSGATTKIVCFNSGGQYASSSDNGATWTTLAGTVSRSLTVGEIPWHATANENSLSNGGGAFNKFIPGQLEVAEGIGVFVLPSAPLTQGANVTWQDLSKGIEGMVSNPPVVTPTGRFLYPCHDRTFMGFDKARVDKYLRQIGTSGNVWPLDHANAVDYARDDETYLVCPSGMPGTTSPGLRFSISTNGGKTWADPPTFPFGTSSVDGGANGDIAVSNTGNFVWIPTGTPNDIVNLGPWVTTNGGTTWTECTFGGAKFSTLPAAQRPTLFPIYYLQRKILVCDKSNGDFYMFIAGYGSYASQAGLWKSTDNGLNFTKVSSGNINTLSLDNFNGKLKMVPGHSPHMFWACGDVDADDLGSVDASLKFWNGTTWAAVGNLYEPYDFAVSAAAPGGSYNTLYAYGYSSAGDTSTRGVYRCLDFNPASPSAATWTKLIDYPGGDYDNGCCMAGDPTQWDRFYICFGGSGGFYADCVDTATAT